ncbi:MAG TPA: photosystem P840 reaction-center cytochrome c-551 [Xanthobacteraceae bacterium]|nr:photosystem P840 reaction-center cytochrome c-551 [Xanthobacteraceae bacterium]
MRTILAALAAALLATAALAEEQEIKLKPGAGLDKVEGNCHACHSLDYIQMNSRFLAPATWEAEVKKMIGAFGAPISDDDAKTIMEYLKANYGAATN